MGLGINVPGIKDSYDTAHGNMMPRTFPADSRLYQFLVSNYGIPFSPDTLTYRIGTVELALHQIADQRGMVDKRNPCVVLCDKDLESVLGLKSFDRTGLRMDLNRRFLVPWDGSGTLASPRASKLETETLTSFRSDPLLSNIPSQTITTETLCRVDPCLRAALMLEEKVTLSHTITHIMTRKEVGAALACYIMARKEKFFDLRNIRTAHVKGDPLEEVFGVPTICRRQVPSLINSKLQPVNVTKKVRLARLAKAWDWKKKSPLNKKPRIAKAWDLIKKIPMNKVLSKKKVPLNRILASLNRASK